MTMEITSVKAIDKLSVHKICSGQVIVNLASAVKELVENSIDAGSTSIEVRLINYGLDLVEICDNGSGINDSNFESLAQKHHTSKLRDFTQLETVSTFGFRGEALSSLCAISDVTIVTRDALNQVGSRIEYDHAGKIQSRSLCPRQTGTTVTLKNLFGNFPVRRKELSKNLKNEFNKMLHILTSYCIISTQVRITCSNQLPNGKKSVSMSTHGNKDVKNNLVNVFGLKQCENLVELIQSEPNVDVLAEFGISDTISTLDIKLRGLISTSDHGCGRNQPDRQFFYINGRPCDTPKVSKLVNEVYHIFNRDQFPFVVLDLLLGRHCLDVNVTPDKRKVFVDNENLLLAVVKSSLVKLYESRKTVLDTHMLDVDVVTVSKPREKLSVINLRRSFSRLPENFSKVKESRQRNLNDFVVKTEKTIFTSTNVKRGFDDDCVVVDSDEESSQQQTKKAKCNVDKSFDVIESKKVEDDDVIFVDMEETEFLNKTLSQDLSENLDVLSTDEKPNLRLRKCVEVEFNINKLQKAINNRQSFVDSAQHRLFTAKITPKDNSTAVVELQKHLDKTSFDKMKILGQFNVGFVVTRLNSDLFIVDQHATDERYNFETLQKSTTIHSQKLFHPQKMELTAVDENVIIENLDIFTKNGFEFNIDNDNRQPGDRVELISVPYSKNIFFGKSDVEELIFMLSDSPGYLCRPSKVQQMFASRACRKSVQIGMALNKSEMTKIIRHMSELDNPWNCAHGRPTIRHLLDLKILRRKF